MAENLPESRQGTSSFFQRLRNVWNERFNKTTSQSSSGFGRPDIQQQDESSKNRFWDQLFYDQESGLAVFIREGGSPMGWLSVERCYYERGLSSVTWEDAELARLKFDQVSLGKNTADRPVFVPTYISVSSVYRGNKSSLSVTFPQISSSTAGSKIGRGVDLNMSRQGDSLTVGYGLDGSVDYFIFNQNFLQDTPPNIFHGRVFAKEELNRIIAGEKLIVEREDARFEFSFENGRINGERMVDGKKTDVFSFGTRKTQTEVVSALIPQDLLVDPRVKVTDPDIWRDPRKTWEVAGLYWDKVWSDNNSQV